MLSSLTNQMQALNEQAHTFAFDIIFSPLKEKLVRVPKLEVSSNTCTMYMYACVYMLIRFGQE